MVSSLTVHVPLPAIGADMSQTWTKSADVTDESRGFSSKDQLHDIFEVLNPCNLSKKVS